MKVGFIGLGQMGLPMARNLLKGGHAVTVFNRTASRAEALRGEGAIVAEQPAAICDSEILISVLAHDAAIEEVLLGGDNLVGRFKPDSIHVCMSTISVAMARKLAEAHARAGSGYVSAPVFGRPDAAAAARLFIAAAGPEPLLRRCQPLFDLLGQKTFVFGEDPPAANVVKLAGNFMIASTLETLGEAFALLRKSGVEPVKFLDFATSSLFAAPIYRTYGDIIVNERYQPAGFKVPLGLKDVRLVLAAAEAAAVPMPIAGIVRDHLLTALARHREDFDWSSVARVVAENAGL
jgi:3-hydroxyisobutyrate dehydrogenase-like beta-hydroxyacid dehydrogenase